MKATSVMQTTEWAPRLRRSKVEEAVGAGTALARTLNSKGLARQVAQPSNSLAAVPSAMDKLVRASTDRVATCLALEPLVSIHAKQPKAHVRNAEALGWHLAPVRWHHTHCEPWPAIARAPKAAPEEEAAAAGAARAHADTA